MPHSEPAPTAVVGAGVAGGAVPGLGAGVVRAWAGAALTRLSARRADLDALNVFPVADSDTGTNLYLTLADAHQAVAACPRDADARTVVRAFARGAVTGARGNSGVIVSQYVGVLARRLVDRPGTSDVLVQALDDAARAAYLAVAEPVEGTVLTVARAVHEGALAASTASTGPGAAPDLLTVLGTGLDRGAEALRRTTSQLPALRAARVWDAGAWGLLLVLEALAEALGGPLRAPLVMDQDGPPTTGAGDEPSPRPCDGGLGTCDPQEGSAGHEHADGRAHDHADAGGEFEVMYLVTVPSGEGQQVSTDGPDDVADGLRRGLAAVGESVAVTGDDGLWQAHVHTDDPWAALAVPSSMGVAQHQVCVRHLASQSGVHGLRRPALGLVTVTTAAGLVADLARAGAVVVLTSGEAPEPGALDRAVDDTGASRVVVVAVPRIGPVVHHGGAGQVVIEVLDGLSEVQVVSAAATLAAQGADGAPDELLGEVCTAVTGVRARRVECRGVGAEEQAGHMHHEAEELLRPGSALLTLVTGERTPAATVSRLRTMLAESHPGVEVVELAGGAPTDTVEMGVE